MKVLHVPFCYFPDPVGGTEVYVEGLVRWQRESGLETAVAAPAAESRSYDYSGSPVHRFQTAKELTLTQLYGEGDPQAALAFDEIMERVRPDLVHLHGFTSGLSLRLVRGARERGVPVIFTYHTPTVTCVRGTLLRWGREQCDGVMECATCASCMLQSKGVPAVASRMLGRVPSAVGSRLGRWGFAGGAWTALRSTELVGLRHQAARSLFAEVECVVAVCEWVRTLLLKNGVGAKKVVLCRQGLGGQVRTSLPERSKTADEGLRIAFLGRLDPVKGVDILIGALQRQPDLRATVDIFGVTQGEDGLRLRNSLATRIAGDRRFRLLDPLPAAQTVERLHDYDVLAVPSQWMESGPLVVYEAFAAGTPVIGSNLGGIAELVRHEINGLLVEPSSLEGWTNSFARFAKEPELLPRLRRGIGPVRTMQQVAGEMQAIYEGLPRATGRTQVVC